MVKNYIILFLGVLFTFVVQSANAQVDNKESAIGKLPIVNGIDSRNYLISDVSFSNWCNERRVRFTTNSISSPSEVAASHFSFGTLPGEGVEVLNYIGFQNNVHVYEVVGTPRNTPATGFLHSSTSDFAFDYDYYNVPTSNSVDALPSINIVDANTVQIPNSLNLNVMEYRWFRNGEPYTTTSNSTFHITEPGSYTVQIVLTSGCISMTSGALTFVTDVAGRIVKECQVYPSPAQSFINVDGIDFRDGDLITVVSIEGKQMLTRSMQLGEVNVTFDVNNLKEGIYFLSVYRNNIPYAFKRFLKN